MPANPYIAGSPVTTPEMFFGREDVFEFVRENLTGQHRDNVLVLYGQRRTGKTSVLYQMGRHLDPMYICIYVDLQGLELKGLNGFLWELATVIVRVLQNEHGVSVEQPSRDQYATDGRSYFEGDFLNQLWSAIGDRHILLMIDEAIRLEEKVQTGELENAIFDYLRHLMQHHERLNFLFSLGSGLETMEKEYTFLFNVALYKRISFLGKSSAIDLIAQPVKDYYQFDQSAIERILEITSCHPYYIQLLCHSLFNRWQQQPKSVIQSNDIDAVLEEVVERGLAVLKHVWEDSTPAEKAIQAALAAASTGSRDPVTIAKLSRFWNPHGVVIPPEELITGIKGLVARDVITGQEKFTFSVDVQRLFVRKYSPMEWVKEEIKETVQQWERELSSRRRKPWQFAAASLTLFLLCTCIILAILSINQPGLIRNIMYFFKSVPPDQIPTQTPSPTIAHTSTLTHTPTLSPTPKLLYQKGRITYMLQDESGTMSLYALNPDGTTIPLAQGYADIMIMDVSPGQDYLALAVTQTGNLDYSSNSPRFVVSLADNKNMPVSLLVVPIDQPNPSLVYSNAMGIDAIFPSDEKILFAILNEAEVTYFISRLDGSQRQRLAISSNRFATPTAAPTELVEPASTEMVIP